MPTNSERLDAIKKRRSAIEGLAGAEFDAREEAFDEAIATAKGELITNVRDAQDSDFNSATQDVIVALEAVRDSK